MNEYRGYIIRQYGKKWTVHDRDGGEQISIPLDSLQAAKNFINTQKRREGDFSNPEE